MKKIVLLFLIVSIGILLSCSQSQQVSRQERKAAEAAYDSIVFIKAEQALNSREFVIEADRVDFKRGRFAYVTPSTNFVSMHGDKATIQLAFNSPYAGPNGIGGITVDGSASNVVMKKDSKGNITFSMMVQGVAVSATVTLRLTQGTNRCTAVVNPNFSSNRISFTGLLYPEEESNVFKGRAL